MNANPDPQLIALAWIVFGTLVACIAAIVALLRSGRSVPPLGGVSLGGPPSDAGGEPPDEAASPSRARPLSGASRRISGPAPRSGRGR